MILFSLQHSDISKNLQKISKCILFGCRYIIPLNSGLALYNPCKSGVGKHVINSIENMHDQVYSNPSLSGRLLYPGICISHEVSGTTPPSDCLHSIYLKAIVKLSTPANKIKMSRILVFKSVNLQ